MFGGTGTFGTTAPTFGGGAFTSANTTNAFGSPQQTSTSLFGGTGGFNANKPAGFGTAFGAPQPTSLFGQQNRLGGNNTMFSNPAAVASPFGSTVPQAQGTSVSFNAITGSDTMMKNGVASPINTRHQCITCMKEYEQKSLEELRLEDYQLGRKGSAQQSTSLFGSTQAQPTGLFSSIAPATNTNTGFAQRAPAFGTTQPTTGGLFSNLAQPKTSFFGTTPATNTFGGTNTAFAFPTSQPQQQSLFGQTNPVTSTVGMGTSTGFTFNQPVQQQQQQMGMGGVFGQKSMAAPVATAAPAFGFTTQTNSALSKPPSFFGSTGTSFTQPSTFGTTTAPAATNIFNANAQAQKPFSFGPTTSTFGTPAASTSFAFSNPVSSAPAFGAPLFGTQTTTTPSLGFTSFGTSTLPTTSTGYGGFTLGNTSLAPATNTPFSFTGNTFAQPNLFQQTPSPATGPVPFATTPYKDSPLFYNLITNRNLENMTKPTNPLAQRAVKEASRRRSSTALGSVGPSLSFKQMTYPVNKSPSLNKQNTLFDGFEDEDHGPAIDILSPKTSVKKLSLKTVRAIHRLSLPTIRSSPLNDTLPLGSVSLNSCNNSGFSHADSSLPFNTTSADESGTEDETVHNQSSRSPSLQREPVEEFGIEGIHRLSPEPGDTISTSPLREKKGGDKSTEGKKNRNGCGVICTLAGYYTKPSVPELDLYMDNDGKCLIREFRVGRQNFGQVKFLEVVNVAGLNIDEIVKFRHKEIAVYPEQMQSPPVGEGLNVRAEVRLLRIWPVNKKTREHIIDPATIRAMKYEDLLRRSCERMDATFVSYDVEDGVWVFNVKHFSKYSCVPEEEDEEEFSPPAAKIPAKGLGGMRSTQIKSIYPQISENYYGVEHMGEKERQLNLNKSDDTQLKIQAKHTVQIIDEPLDHTNALAQTRDILGSIFFPDDSGMGDIGSTETSISLELDDRYSSGYETQFLRESGEDEGDSRTPLSRSFSQFGIGERVGLFQFSDGADLFAPPHKPRGFIYRKRDEIQRKPVSRPFELFSQLRNDPSSVHLPPRGTYVCLGSMGQIIQIRNNATMSPLIQFHGQVVMKRLFSKIKQIDKPGNRDFQSILEAQLQLYRENSVLSDEDCYSINSSGIVAAHVETIHRLLAHTGASFGPHHVRNLKEEMQVWKLLEILTGSGKGLKGGAHQRVEMMQRARLSKWLTTNGSMLFSNLFVPGDTSVKGLLLKGMKQEASRQAIREKNYTLGLCLVQSNQETQSQCRSQLEFWETEEAIPFIDQRVLEIYGLCAGYPIWSGVDFNRMTTSEWLQHFATFIWYLAPINLPIDYVVSFFQSAVKESFKGVSEDFAAPAMEVTSSTLANLCIHLLKMYSSVGYPLHKLLSPNSHTTDIFDYKVSWFLLQAFLTIGIQVEAGLVESITTSFAQQLEMHGMWEWSLFILKFLPPTEPRRVSIRRLMERHLNLGRLALGRDEFEKKIFFLECLGITEAEIFECKL